MGVAQKETEINMSTMNGNFPNGPLHSLDPHFGMLQTGKGNPASIAVAAIINFTILLLAIVVSFASRKAFVPHNYDVTELALPVTPPPAKMKVPPMPKAHPMKLQAPKIEAPKVTVASPLPAPKIEPIRVQSPKPQFQAAKQRVVLAPQAKITHLFASQPAQQQRPRQTVAAVKFGQTLGIKSAAHGAVMAAAFGSPIGGSRGLGSPRGHVASSGFGGRSFSGGGRARGQVASTGFGAAPRSTSVARVTHTQPQTTQLAILSKPPVEYTKEAREKKIQGNIVLNVTFTASGQVIVNRVVRGLGYGLDDEARRVATEIRFHPATRGGHPVDMTTNIIITFQLA